MASSSLSHKNNLIQKSKRIKQLTPKRLQILDNVKKNYVQYLKEANWSEVKKGNVVPAVKALDNYVNYTKEIEKQDSFFNWRSDFAGSVIPEFLFRVFSNRLRELNIPHFFSTRGSVVEMTLNGTADNAWNIRRKNQDLCLGGAICSTIIEGAKQSFVVPSIIFEVKTNIDINKLNGLEFSAERLKRTFPTAKYFLVTETVDFSLKDNYVAGHLDEIYCLRKQVRSEARRNKAALKSDVFQKLLDDVVNSMRLATTSKGHVYDRLETGKLINA
ncbi:Bpu10I family restriction endonuclease [Thalassotalea aquiviva]|uniref:Bpu10I family restriction endonuclease n=1 Tax=Thalassotalea aquiviva TaxID=3242415 RepID=UPI00352A131F